MSQARPVLCRSHRPAAAVVEFALLAPLLCFAFVVAVDFARVFYYSLTLSNCARNGAMYGSADQSHALDSSGIQSATLRDAMNLNTQTLTVVSSTDSTSQPTSVSVTATYSFTTITRYPGVPSQISLQRTVRMSVVPATPTFN